MKNKQNIYENKDEEIQLFQLYKGQKLSTPYYNFFASNYIQLILFIISLILNTILILFIIFFVKFDNLNLFEEKDLNSKGKNEYKVDDYFYKLRLDYLHSQGYKYDEYNLVTFQDKINWLIIHDSTPLKTKCSDKILVHEYSIEKLGKDICNKILKIYDNVNEINFDELPDQYAIKTNHGNSYNIIVKDKKTLYLPGAKQLLNNWMHSNYGEYRKEFHYSFIKPKIFVEEFIGGTLKNYKLLCYGGEPKYIYVSISEGENKYRNFYDMDWNFKNFHCLSEPHPTLQYPKPKFFEEMKEIARKLSADFRFVRVDLYELENEVRLGELTFTPMNSFFNCSRREDEVELGRYIDTTFK